MSVGLGPRMFRAAVSGTTDPPNNLNKDSRGACLHHWKQDEGGIRVGDVGEDTSHQPNLWLREGEGVQYVLYYMMIQYLNTAAHITSAIPLTYQLYHCLSLIWLEISAPTPPRSCTVEWL